MAADLCKDTSFKAVLQYLFFKRFNQNQQNPVERAA